MDSVVHQRHTLTREGLVAWEMVAKQEKRRRRRMVIKTLLTPPLAMFAFAFSRYGGVDEEIGLYAYLPLQMHCIKQVVGKRERIFSGDEDSGCDMPWVLDKLKMWRVRESRVSLQDHSVPV